MENTLEWDIKLDRWNDSFFLSVFRILDDEENDISRSYELIWGVASFDLDN